MGSLRQAMEEYLAMRRGLGFKLQEAGLRLKDFVSFMEERRARRITSPAGRPKMPHLGPGQNASPGSGGTKDDYAV